jgi:hypothetical protein
MLSLGPMNILRVKNLCESGLAVGCFHKSDNKDSCWYPYRDGLFDVKYTDKPVSLKGFYTSDFGTDPDWIPIIITM